VTARSAIGRIFAALFFLALPAVALAAEGDAALPVIRFGVEQSTSPQDFTLTLQIVFLLTILALAPSIIILLTSFTRIIVVLSFLKNAMGANMPPAQVLTGLAIMLTFFIMAPVYTPVYENAILPYSDGQISQAEALERAEGPIRKFLLRQTSEKDIALFVRLSDEPMPKSAAEVPLTALVPAFVISELRTAFTIGFIIYIPFVIVDMVIASTLMSMGMFMLPPMMISLPFKLVLFVIVDGWNLVVGSLAKSFFT
jgi:flagellar biosynthetic protein FliP